MKLIMEDMLTAFRENLMRDVEGVNDPEEKLAIAVILYFRVMDRHREKTLLMYQKSASLDRAAKIEIMKLEVEVSEIFCKIIEEGIQRGGFKKVDLDLMAYNIIMMAHMWVLKRWHFKTRLTLDRYIDLQLAAILDALRKK